MKLHLSPPRFGPDRELGRAVCQNIMDTMPATLVPWHPGQGRTARLLRSAGIGTQIDDTPRRPHVLLPNVLEPRHQGARYGLLCDTSLTANLSSLAPYF